MNLEIGAPADTRPAIFLSYARADDEPFVTELYGRLDAAGFDVWFDRVRMPSRGLTFLQEIRAAVMASERLVVVIGEKALTSDYVRAEWQAALAYGRVVVPVVRQGRRGSLPAELGGLHAVDALASRDLDATVAELVRVLRDPLPRIGPLIGQVPDIPPNYRPRPDEMTALAAVLLRDARKPDSLAGPQRATLLHGLPGVGKSVVATGLARAFSTRRAFPDGVVWHDVGEHSTATAVVGELAGLLVRDAPAAPTLAQGVSFLREALQEKSLLVVLDNVWDAAQVTPVMDAIGPACRALITTRIADVAASLGTNSRNLDALGSREAARLLADWAGAGEEPLPDAALDVLAMCGGLPLAIALNGAMRATGTSWNDLKARLEKAALDFAEKPLARYPYKTVAHAIRVSVDRLEASRTGAAARFTDLSVFLGSAAIPETAVLRLWLAGENIEPEDGRKLLTTLAGQSLLRLDGIEPWRRVVLHDLVRDYLRATAGEMTPRHVAFVDGYRRGCPRGWASGPNDGYVQHYLLEHLVLAGRGEVAHEVLGEQDEWQRNAWFAARQAAGDERGFLADCERAWQLASEMPGDAGTDVARSWRYALMAASLRARSQLLHPALVVRALELGMMPASEALAVASRGNDHRRGRVLGAIAGFLDLPDLLVAAKLVEEMRGEFGPAIAGLAPRLAALGMQSEALGLLDMIENETEWLGTFRQIVGGATEDALPQAEAQARGRAEVTTRIAALAAIAERRGDAGQELANEILASARRLRKPDVRLAALASAARVANRAQIKALLESQDVRRDHHLAPLLRYACLERLVALGEPDAALEALLAHDDPGQRDGWLSHLAERLVHAGAPELAARAVEEISDAERQAEVAAHLAGALPEAAARVADSLLHADSGLQRRVDAHTWARLAQAATGELRARLQSHATDVARGRPDAARQAWDLGRAAIGFDEPQRSELLREALMLAEGVDKATLNEELLPSFVPFLDADQLTRALQLAQHIDDDFIAFEPLVTCAREIDATLAMSRAFAALDVVKREKDLGRFAFGSAKATAWLGRAANESWLESILEDIDEHVGEVRTQLECVTELADAVPQLRERIVAHATRKAERASGAERVRWRLIAVEWGDPAVPDHTAQALNDIGRLTQSFDRAPALIALAAALPPALSGQFGDMLQRRANAIRDDETSLRVASPLLPKSPADEHEKRAEALEARAFKGVRDLPVTALADAVWSLLDVGRQSDRLLPGLKQRSPELAIFAEAARAAFSLHRGLVDADARDTWLQVILEVATLMDPASCGRLVESAAPFLSGEQFLQGVHCALDLNQAAVRRRTLNALCVRLARLPADERLRQWHGVAHLLSARPRPALWSSLAAFAPALAVEGDGVAARGVMDAIDDVRRWWP